MLGPCSGRLVMDNSFGMSVGESSSENDSWDWEEGEDANRETIQFPAFLLCLGGLHESPVKVLYLNHSLYLTHDIIQAIFYSYIRLYSYPIYILWNSLALAIVLLWAFYRQHIFAPVAF